MLQTKGHRAKMIIPNRKDGVWVSTHTGGSGGIGEGHERFRGRVTFATSVIRSTHERNISTSTPGYLFFKWLERVQLIVTFSDSTTASTP